MSRCDNFVCAAQIFLDSRSNESGNGHSGTGRSRHREYSVSFKGAIPSYLPSFLLPCPHCGHRMAITAVTPARFVGVEANDLEDITHGCVQCGTTLTRTVRPLTEDDQATAIRVSA